MATIYKAKASEEYRIRELQTEILKLEEAIELKKDLIEKLESNEEKETRARRYHYQRLIIHWENTIKAYNEEINDIMMEIRCRW